MDSAKVPGCSFLVSSVSQNEVFTPEDFTEDHVLIAKTTEQFLKKEVLPNEAKFEAKQFGELRNLLKRSAELGLLGADIPEEWGGLDLDKIASAIITEKLGASSYFLVAFAAHIGIGTLPLRLFGNLEQKKKYLERLAQAEIIGAYALTEPSAGSDAAAIKTNATLSPEGIHYLLNGGKIWISNAGFADLFTVFAKVDNDPKKITAFLVERDFPGFTVGPEEHKLGLHGSSTCPLTFDSTPVSKENVLGEVGEGLKIALNILNLGRFKLAAGCVGGAKALLTATAVYARDRVAFGKPIASFGLIKNKFGTMIAKLWLAETMAYRTAGLLDNALKGVSAEDSKATMSAVAEYAVECSINKVFASEMLDEVIDECLQIYGGMGFEHGSPPARAYRDARVNRIFEGTSEINRLFAAKRIIGSDETMKGTLPIFASAQKYFEELMAAPVAGVFGEANALSSEMETAQNLKKLTVLLLGASVRKWYTKLSEEQEVLAKIVNCAMCVFALESGILRAKKRIERGASADVETAIVKIATDDIAKKISNEARDVAARLAEGDDLKVYQSVIRKLTKYESCDCIGLARLVADFYLDGSWRFF